MAVAQVIGGGLAGCEAAWQLAERGHTVELLEMRPSQSSPAHQTDRLAELVCTNSFKSEESTNAHGLLKREMRTLGSLLLASADATRVPAGAALAVDRDRFASSVTHWIERHPRIRLCREEIAAIPTAPAVLATGPLTSAALSESLAALLGARSLAFYDSIAPIVGIDSLDLERAFYGSRYGKGTGDDYLNCPLDCDTYLAFVEQLRRAEVYPGHEWENIPFFEGCLPLEVMAERGVDTLRFGPMKPVGLREPAGEHRPYAVLQLRREDRHGQMWNLVGCQTRLRTGAQRRVFRLIPALRDAEFLRYGSIHRNTYLDFPSSLNEYGAPHARRDLIIAGQLTGVEGYMESAASGILAGINMDRILCGRAPVVPPSTTMLGALYRYLREAEPGRFQPMNSNFGLLDPPAERVRDKQQRRQLLATRAQADLAAWLERYAIPQIVIPVGAAA